MIFRFFLLGYFKQFRLKNTYCWQIFWFFKDFFVWKKIFSKLSDFLKKTVIYFYFLQIFSQDWTGQIAYSQYWEMKSFFLYWLFGFFWTLKKNLFRCFFFFLFWDFKCLGKFLIFFFGFFKVKKVTTEHQKWPKISTDSVKSSFFCLKGKEILGRRPVFSAGARSKLV